MSAASRTSPGKCCPNTAEASAGRPHAAPAALHGAARGAPVPGLRTKARPGETMKTMSAAKPPSEKPAPSGAAAAVFNAVLVPQIIKASKGPDRGADYISRLLTLAVVVLLSLTLLVTLLAPWVIELTTQGYSPQQKSLAVSFAFWCLPQIFFYGLYALLTQVLNANGAFGPAMWAPILNNVVAIAGLGMFIGILGTNEANPHTLDNWGSFQTLLVAGFSTIGVVAQTAILMIPVLRLRLGLRPRFGWRGVGLGQAAKLSVWTLATAAVGQLAFLYIMRIATIPGAERLRLQQAGDTAAAATLPGNAVLEVASQLYLLPHSIIALSLATVLFNRMTRASQDGNRAELR